MRMYDLIMMMPTLKKEVLIQFGFGEVNPKDVEQWIYQKYPQDYMELKQGLAHYKRTFGNDNILPLKRETMSREERSAMCSLFEANQELMLQRITDEVLGLENKNKF